MRFYTGYGGGLSAADIRRSEERITQLQAFLNEQAPWTGEHSIEPNGIWFPQTEGLYYRIVSYLGYSGLVFDGMWSEIVDAFGVDEPTAKAWEWAIMVARQREDRPVVAPTRLTGGTPRVLSSEEAGIADGSTQQEKKSYLPWVLGIGVGVLGLVGIIALSKS